MPSEPVVDCVECISRLAASPSGFVACLVCTLEIAKRAARVEADAEYQARLAYIEAREV